MTQYAVILYRTADGARLTADERDAHHRHADELTRTGTMLSGIALQAGSTAMSIRGDVVTDGPFIEAKEVLAGLYVIEAPDLDAAVEIARRNPVLQQGGGVEVRPVDNGPA
jgi:hypothetical protein